MRAVSRNGVQRTTRPTSQLLFDEIEPLSRSKHVGHRVAVANGRRRRSGFAVYTRCLELDANVVDAGVRGVKGDCHRPGRIIDCALSKVPMRVCTGRVIDVATRLNREQRVEVAGGDPLVYHERVVAGWRRDLHPVVENTRGLFVDLPVLDAVLHSAEGLGGASGKILAGCPGGDLTHHLYWCRCCCRSGSRR